MITLSSKNTLQLGLLHAVQSVCQESSLSTCTSLFYLDVNKGLIFSTGLPTCTNGQAAQKSFLFPLPFGQPVHNRFLTPSTSTLESYPSRRIFGRHTHRSNL